VHPDAGRLACNAACTTGRAVATPRSHSCMITARTIHQERSPHSLTPSHATSQVAHVNGGPPHRSLFPCTGSLAGGAFHTLNWRNVFSGPPVEVPSGPRSSDGSRPGNNAARYSWITSYLRVDASAPSATAGHDHLQQPVGETGGARSQLAVEVFGRAVVPVGLRCTEVRSRAGRRGISGRCRPGW
jgi:hypothetical protein